jgi:hypothetical protein
MHNIHCKYSDNGGATWVNGGVTADKITSDTSYAQQWPSICVDTSNNVYILWHGGYTSFSELQIKQIKFSGTSWGSISAITSVPVGSSYYQINPQTLGIAMDFTEPLFIWQDTQTSKIKFRGKWNIPGSDCIVVWKPDTASNIPISAYITSDEALNSAGTITYYISRDNGGSFVQCTKDTLVDISSEPSGTFIVCKVVMTADAILKAIAWGWK